MEITKYPNSILASKIKQVEEITPDLLALINDMKAKMIEAKGVGLAGNQVGLDLAIFIIDKDLAKEHKVPEVYINPQITEYSKDSIFMEEGCLSLPERWLNITRSKKVYLKATDEKGNKLKIRARGFLARVYQHENDHLNGLLIKDRFEKQNPTKK